MRNLLRAYFTSVLHLQSKEYYICHNNPNKTSFTRFGYTQSVVWREHQTQTCNGSWCFHIAGSQKRTMLHYHVWCQAKRNLTLTMQAVYGDPSTQLYLSKATRRIYHKELARTLYGVFQKVCTSVKTATCCLCDAVLKCLKRCQKYECQKSPKICCCFIRGCTCLHVKTYL
jgi:hypothetical protein